MIEWKMSMLGWSIMDGNNERAIVVQDGCQWYWRANFPGNFAEGKGFQQGKCATRLLAQKAAIEAIKNTSRLLNLAVDNLPRQA